MMTSSGVKLQHLKDAFFPHRFCTRFFGFIFGQLLDQLGSLLHGYLDDHPNLAQMDTQNDDVIQCQVTLL